LLVDLHLINTGCMQLSNFIFAAVSAAMTPGPPGPITWRAAPVGFELLRAATVQGPIVIVSVSVRSLTKKNHMYIHARENFFC